MERLKRLLDCGVIVPAVDLIKVDIIGSEPPQAGVDLSHDRFARQPGSVLARTLWVVDFGRDDDLIAVGEITQGAADDSRARPL